MKYSFGLPLLIGVTASFPHSLSAQAHPDSVALSFNWPVGLEAAISHRRLQILSGDHARPESTSVLVEYQMRVGDDSRGRLVEYRNFRFPGLSSPTDQAQSAGWLEQVASAGTPSLVVNDSGEMVSVADPEGFAATLRAMVQPMIDSLPAQKAGLRDLFQRLLNPDVLGARAAGEWNALVGWWAGAKLERGSAIETTDDQPLALFGGKIVPYHTRRTFLSRERCTAAARESLCVELELISVPDSAVIRELIGGILAEATRNGAQVTALLRHMEAEYRIRVLVEPKGLIPHAMDMIQSFQVEVESPAEGVSRQSMERSAMVTYTYGGVH